MDIGQLTYGLMALVAAIITVIVMYKEIKKYNDVRDLVAISLIVGWLLLLLTKVL